MASELREPENQIGDFPETTAFERYLCIIALAYLDLIRLLGDTRSHNEGRVSTPACIYYLV